MAGFDREKILELITDMEVEDNVAVEIVRKDDDLSELPDELKDIVDVSGAMVIAEYVNLGQFGYGATGIFAFTPDEGLDDIQELNISIVLDDEIDDTAIYDMYKIINMINLRLAGGSFILSDDEKAMIYRNRVSFLPNVDEESSRELLSYKVLESLFAVSGYVDIIMGLNDGSKEYDECIELVTAERE